MAQYTASSSRNAQLSQLDLVTYQLIITKPTWVPDRLVTIHPNLNLYLVCQSDLAVEGSVEGNAQAGATSPIGHACFCRAEVTAL